MARQRQTNAYPLRIDKRVMEDLKIISEQEGRSVNKQIEYIIRLYIDSERRSERESEREKE